ncbi:hypothetical protein V2O64_23380 [Verrucomicrobiaceae bacterium 227]
MNLDSLMDALTDVVAVLILVLVLAQMDVTQKVVEFMDNLEPATPEELAESRKAVEEAVAIVAQKEALLSEEPPTPEALEEETRQLALLEKNARGQRLRVVHNPPQTRLHIEVKPNAKEGGTGFQELEEPSNSFDRAMKSVRGNQTYGIPITEVEVNRLLRSRLRLHRLIMAPGRLRLSPPWTKGRCFL